MRIKVLAFAGSPRRHGNSEALLDWVLDAMQKEEDADIEKVILVDADVNPCRGCNACETLNRCVQRDGMDTLHDKIIDADLIILSAPIYCMGICSQAKALIDRFQVFRSRKYVLKLPIVPPERKGKRIGIFLSSAGQNWDHVFNGALPTVKCFFHVIDVRDKDIRYLMVNGVDEKGAILKHPSAQRDARLLAHEVITDIRARLAGVILHMPVRVLGISGSPHRHGNTETLLDAFLEGAANAGGSVEKIILKDLDYTPCRGCNVCHKEGECIVRDEAVPLLEQVLSVDCLAVASPIYSMGITAELKGLIDRSQYIWARKFILKSLYFTDKEIHRRKGIFISTAGLSWDNVFDAAFPAITAFFNTMGFEYYDNIIANDMDRYRGIRGHPTALTHARAKGEEVIRVIERMSRD